MWTCGPSGSLWPLLSALHLVWAVFHHDFDPSGDSFNWDIYAFCLGSILELLCLISSFSLCLHPAHHFPYLFLLKHQLEFALVIDFLSSLLIFLFYYPTVHLLLCFLTISSALFSSSTECVNSSVLVFYFQDCLFSKDSLLKKKKKSMLFLFWFPESVYFLASVRYLLYLKTLLINHFLLSVLPRFLWVIFLSLCVYEFIVISSLRYVFILEGKVWRPWGLGDRWVLIAAVPAHRNHRGRSPGYLDLGFSLSGWFPQRCRGQKASLLKLLQSWRLGPFKNLE